MKKLPCIMLLYILLLGFIGCKKVSQKQEAQPTPKTPVEVVSVGHGSVDDDLTLFGTTVYLKRNLVTAPIPAFIIGVSVKLGDQVSQGDVLFTLQSKESRALENDIAKIDTTLSGFGIIKIRASASGTISTLDKQQPGDYVLEGGQLCTIAESRDLVFQVNVPFEYTAYTTTGAKCNVILPDNTKHPAAFTTALTAMNVLAQTQTILAKSAQNLLLPENMIVKVIVRKSKGGSKQTFPRSAVLADEMMQQYWVMKLVNDSTAVKVPVQIGNRNTDQIEVRSPIFSSSDRIVSTGGYGLADTSRVSITR